MSLLWCFDPISGHGLVLRGFTITLRHTAFGRTPPDERSARRRDLYLATHNNNTRQTSMPRWDSNPQSQPAGGRRPMPWTTRPYFKYAFENEELIAVSLYEKENIMSFYQFVLAHRLAAVTSQLQRHRPGMKTSTL